MGLYLSPTDRAVVLRVDEKSRIRAPDRTQPVPPLRPGIPERRTHDYKRNGTPPLFAASDVATGFVIGKCYKRHRPKEFPDFLKEIAARVPKGPDVHIVMDNTPPTRPPPSGHGRRGGLISTVHSTPTSASRIDRVERRFAEPTREQLQRGTHASARQPEADIRAFIETHNQNPKPFRRTKSADDILAAAKRFHLQVNYNSITNFYFK